MFENPLMLFGLIGVLGIGAQWIAWRLSMPAIVLMLAAGLIAGPGLGWINPEAAFGDLFNPIVSAAVAIILFEGGLTLNFKESRHTATAVRRLVYVGAPLAWIPPPLVLHYAVGPS